MINWLGDIVTSGDFGQSTLTNRSIGPELIQRLMNTLHVGVATMIVGMLVGVPAGMLSAIKPNSIADRLVTMLSVGGVAIPDYLIGLILILVFVAGCAPAAGFERIWVDPVASIRALIIHAGRWMSVRSLRGSSPQCHALTSGGPRVCGSAG